MKTYNYRVRTINETIAKVPVLVAEVSNPQNTLQLHDRIRLEPFVSGHRLNVSVQ